MPPAVLAAGIGAAGGIGSALLGGGGREETTTQNVDPRTDAFIQQFLRPLSQQGAQAALDPANQQIAGLTGTGQAGIAGLLGLGGQLGDFQQQLRGFREASPVGFGFSPGQFDVGSATQEFLDPVIAQGINAASGERRQLDELRARQLAEAQGAFGGSRSAVFEAQAGRNAEIDRMAQLAQAVERAQGRAQNQFSTEQGLALQAALGRQQGQIATRGQNLQSFGLGLGALGQGQSLAGQLLQAGELERGIEQARLNAPLQGFQNALGFAGQGIGVPGLTSQFTGGGTNPFAAGIGGATLGLGIQREIEAANRRRQQATNVVADVPQVVDTFAGRGFGF